MTPPPPLRRRLRWWALLLAATLALAAGLVTGALTLLTPPFASIDELTAANVAGLHVFILNRPDGGPDIGTISAAQPIPPERTAAVLAVLRGAERVDPFPPKVWLGKLIVTLTDGRKQTVMLYWVAEDQERKRPLVLRFAVEGHRFAGGTADELIRRVGGE